MTNILARSVNQECIKCAKILRSFSKVGVGIPGQGASADQFIPTGTFSRAKGVVILTVAKAGYFLGGRGGSGLVIARLPNGSWSAPSAIATGGVSFGVQIGGEITEYVILLNTDAAVKAFAKSGNVTLGGNLSVAAGPYGRTGEVSGTAKSIAAIYSYSKSKGLFAGVSIEGSVILTRSSANEKLYGKNVTAKQLLYGEIPVPGSAMDLRAALMEVTSTVQVINYGSLNSGAGPLITNLDSDSSNSDHDVRQVPPMSLSKKPAVSQDQISSLGLYPAPSSMHSATDSESVTAVAMFDFTAQKEGDLSFLAGDIITVLNRGNERQWWFGRLRNQEGVFPANYVEINAPANYVEINAPAHNI